MTKEFKKIMPFTKKFRRKSSAFTMYELSIVILIIGILIAGITLGSIIVKKSRIAAAQMMTSSSPINGIKDSALWLETSVESNYETNDQQQITEWNDARLNAVNKPSIDVVGTGPEYSNTINYVHAIKFSGSSTNHLQIADASFLNNTDYTIFILEKKMDNSSNSYFFGDSPTGTANQKLALGYKSDGTITHAQGTNSYDSNVSPYSESADKPRLLTFIQDSTQGKKTYVNGVLAQSSSDTAQLSGLTTLAIGKSYKGEIGEIAIFTRALKAEERKSVEDYMGKKWTTKMLRDVVAGGSCTTGMVTSNGCSMVCSTASVVGITSPTSINDGSTSSFTCGQSGFSGASISLTCSNGSLSGGSCVCASGYTMVGSTCVQQCSVSVNGSNVTTVAAGVTQVACNAGGNYATSPFTFTACSGSSISGSCGCVTGYTGSTCSTCASGYTMVSGTCQQQCTINGQVGMTDGTTVNAGSTSTTCNGAGGYLGNITYTCSSGTLSSVVNNCKLPCTGGTRTVASTGKIIHTFNSGGTLNCPEAKTVDVLVVAGGGGGGSVNDGWAGGGGGAGGLTRNQNFSVAANTNYTVTIGAGGNIGGVGATSSIVSASSGSISTVGGGTVQVYSNPITGGSGAGATNNSTVIGSGTAGQGNSGGASYRTGANLTSFSGGGGGACGAGGAGAAGIGGAGGAGCPIDMDGDGTPTYYAGGGGGGNHPNHAGGRTDDGAAGIGGGGGGGTTTGTPNTGGGGPVSGAGGSGVVIVAY